MATLEQKIAQKEKELARLKEKSRKLETGQKVVIGGMMLSLARNDIQRAKTLLSDIKIQVNKKTDVDRLKPIIDELEKMVSKSDKPQF